MADALDWWRWSYLMWPYLLLLAFVAVYIVIVVIRWTLFWKGDN